MVATSTIDEERTFARIQTRTHSILSQTFSSVTSSVSNHSRYRIRLQETCHPEATLRDGAEHVTPLHTTRSRFFKRGHFCRPKEIPHQVLHRCFLIRCSTPRFRQQPTLIDISYKPGSSRNNKKANTVSSHQEGAWHVFENSSGPRSGHATSQNSL